MRPAVSLTDVSKRFKLYHDRPRSIKEMVLHRRRAAYEELWALRDVSLHVEGGQNVGLIGPNGSGKSTMLKLIAGIHRPTSGTVEVSGVVGALLEIGAGFHPELTGRENVFLNGSIMGFSRRAIKARFDEIVDFSGLERFIDSPIRVYSSGMYVRLGFSVAATLDADILLVDEILGVGDEEFQRKCMARFAALDAKGVSVILVSHSMAAVQSLCSHAVLMNQGRIERQGPTAEVVDFYLRRFGDGGAGPQET